MGANAQTSVPAFTSGQVLTAAQMTQVNTGIPVFASSTERDAAFGGAGEKTLAQGQLAYLEDTGAVQVYDGSAWQAVGGALMKKVEAFTASGTWTVPAGVTYAVAHMLGGGGGGGDQTQNGSDGGDSSVAFAGGTVTAPGGVGANLTGSGGSPGIVDQAANSGRGGYSNTRTWSGGDAQWVVAGDTVTPAASITVTVGAAGAGGSGGVNNPGGDGGSGYVWIEYYEEA
jgi:hypothetical protein